MNQPGVPFSVENSSAMRRDYDRFFESNAEENRKTQYLARNVIPRLKGTALDSPLLEVGPGRGALLDVLRKEGYTNLTCFEVCEAFAEKLRARGFAVASGHSAVEYFQLLPESSLGIVFLIDVLEHLPLEEGLIFLRECRRVLNKNGKLIIQTPNASGLFGLNTFVADPTHSTPWNELRLTSALRGVGFAKVYCFPMQLPLGLGNLLRTIARKPVFAMARFLMRLCGATPVRVLTHNIVCEASGVL